MSHRYLIGIDPGVKTGVAVWDRKRKLFVELKTLNIIESMSLVIGFAGGCVVRFEDARKRKWFGKADRERLQGAGSIKRDSSIWEEFCLHNDIPFDSVAPMANKTKISAPMFAKFTGVDWRTSEHARDAAMLVFQG